MSPYSALHIFSFFAKISSLIKRGTSSQTLECTLVTELYTASWSLMHFFFSFLAYCQMSTNGHFNMLRGMWVQACAPLWGPLWELRWIEYKNWSTPSVEKWNQTQLVGFFFLFYGKITIQRISYAAKIFVAKMLVAKMSTRKMLVMKITDMCLSTFLKTAKFLDVRAIWLWHVTPLIPKVDLADLTC